MRRAGGARIAAAFLLAASFLPGRARAEVVEEIVAWVNGDIITRSDLEREEQGILGEIYRRYTGPELDAQVKVARAEMLDRMIDRKILVQRASQLYDLSKMRNALLDSFKEQQKVQSDQELERLLAQEGMTLDELKDRLVDMYAPEEIIRFEVFGRVSVSEKEVAEYFVSRPQNWEVPATATVREIVFLAEGEAKERRRADAEKIRERAMAPGADFAALAREVSEAGTKANGGLLGPVGKGDLAPQLDQVVFSLPVGEVSPVLEMPHGFHLIRVESRDDARAKSLTEVKDSIRELLEREKSEKALVAYLEKARGESDIVVADAYKSRLPSRSAPKPQGAEKEKPGP